MIELFNALFYQPLYNGFIFLFDSLSFFDAGIIVVVFTLIVKFALYPLSKKSIKSQLELKQIQPEIDKIKQEHKNDSQEQARKTLELYREKNIKPFTSIIIIFIQIPIVFALYFVFLKSGLPDINKELLYPFVQVPQNIDMDFLGLIDISTKSKILALLAGVSSFIQLRLSVPPLPKRKSKEPNFKDELARSMNLQMKYVFPVLVFFIAYKISGAIALYWFTSNVFAAGQQYLLNKKNRKETLNQQTVS